MANPKKINLGVFMAGEIPFPFKHTFKDSNGLAIDLSGWNTPYVRFTGPDEAGSYGTGLIDFETDGSDGVVLYTFVENDFQDSGKYQFLIWVEDGTNRLASDLVVYEVYDGPGATPPAT